MAQYFNFQKIQITKSTCLGVGSYGSVYRAMCDTLPCAAKILHPTLFETNDPGARRIIEQFEQECNFLSGIRHPHIVQYLGLARDPETRLPVLLIELMDDSLTQFLERSKEPLPYHTQVDLGHDIALALAYLHSNGIIHRDLSSNNVLLIAGSRAKVTDFGLAKVFDMSRTTMTPQTMCPGTLAYMSPEAFDDPPVYTKKLDSFSFGVLDIQIITQQFPNPGPRVKKIKDPSDPKRRLHEVVPETERRKSHVDLIDPTDPLLPIAIDCLSYSEEDRPSAQDLCHRLAALKEASQYSDSVHQVRSRAEGAPADREDRERQMKELQEQTQEPHREKVKRDEQLQHLQQQLQVCGDQIREKDAVIAAREQELQEATREKDHVIESRERQLREQSQQLAASEKGTAQLQQNLLQREKMIQELQEEKESLQRTGKLTFRWRSCEEAPCKMRRGSATVHGSMAYFGPDSSRQVFSYNSDTEEWSTLPECPRTDFTLTVVNGLITAVGGTKFLVSNTLFSLMEDGGRRKWVEHFPRMPTKRALAAVVCSGKALVVAGGQGDWWTKLTTVEVMNTDTLKWSTASSLPYPLHNTSATICGDQIYLVGGCGQDGWTRSVLTCSLNCLLQSLIVGTKNHLVWFPLAYTPVFKSTCVTLNGKLLAVGGRVHQFSEPRFTYSNSVYLYNPVTDFWEITSRFTTPRYSCLAAVLPGNKLMVVGGAIDVVGIWTTTAFLDKVEIGSVE